MKRLQYTAGCYHQLTFDKVVQCTAGIGLLASLQYRGDIPLAPMSKSQISKADIELAGEVARRRSSLLLRHDLTVNSDLGSHHAGHSE